MAHHVLDINFPEDFYQDDVGVWRLKKEKLAEMEDPRPQTNEEWLRSCSTEQLAEYLSDVFYGLLDDVWGNDGDTSCDYRETEKNYWVEWLKQPHSPK
jgi:hypothetical protein